MNKGRIYFLSVVFMALLAACSVRTHTYDLAKDYATSLHYEGANSDEEVKGAAVEEKSELVGVPFRNFYGGDLKRGGVWFGGKGITLEKGDVFVFDAENVGLDSIPFGAAFQPIDMLKEPVQIKISARAAGKDNAPVLYLELADGEGYKANAIWPSQKIENSEEFKEYYFDLKDIFVQKTPKKHSVNGAFINGLKFFINPGQTAYTGQIFIKEIKVVPVAKP